MTAFSEHVLPKPPTSVRRMLAAGSALAIGGQILRMATALVSVPLTVAYLGQERYALWMVSLSTLTFVTFLDGGLTPTLKNRMSAARARGDEQEFRRYASASVAFSLAIIGIGALTLPILRAIDWAAFFRVSSASAAAEAVPVTLVVFGTALASFALSGVESIYAAELRMTVVSVAGIAVALASFLLLLLGIRLQVGLPLLALAVGAPVPVARLALLIGYWARDRSLRMPPWREVGRLARELAPTAGLFMAIQATNVLLSAMPNLLITRHVSLTAVTAFTVGNRLAMIPLSLVAAVMPVFWPVFTAAWARRERSVIRRRLAILVSLTATGAASFAAAMIVAGPWIISKWTGSRVAVDRPVLAALGAWLVLQSIGHWLSTFLHSISSLRFQLVCYVIQAVALFTFSAILAPWFALPGVVVAMVAALGIGSIAPLAARTARLLREPADFGAAP